MIIHARARRCPTDPLTLYIDISTSRELNKCAAMMAAGCLPCWLVHPCICVRRGPICKGLVGFPCLQCCAMQARACTRPLQMVPHHAVHTAEMDQDCRDYNSHLCRWQDCWVHKQSITKGAEDTGRQAGKDRQTDKQTYK